MKKAFIQLHAAILLAGFTGILGKVIQLSEGYLAWYRMALSALFIGVILLVAKKLLFPGFSNVLKLVGIGAIISLHWICFYGSIKYSNVSVSVTCLSATGFFTSLMEPLIIRRQVDYVEVALGILAICGVYLIFNFYPEYKTGIIFGITAALLGSVFPILNKSVLKRYTPMTINLYEMGGGALALAFILPVYLKFFPAIHVVPTVTDWFWLVVLSLVCTVVAFDLGLKALNRLTTFTVNLSYNFEPIYAIIMAFIIFKENRFLGPGFYAGFTLILTAVTLQMIRAGYAERKIKPSRFIKMSSQISNLKV